MQYSGVCHSDLSVMRNGWAGVPPTPSGQVGGHEGVGIVEALGVGADEYVKLGDRVGIKWVAAKCGTCTPCTTGFDGHCTLRKYTG